MTYPPQPGQNDPHGQQPGGGYPQSGGFGQQQQPQYGEPQYGEPQPGQAQFGQQPQYGQQYPQSGPQQPPYGGFGTYNQQPPRKRGPLPWILAGGGVLVAAVVVVLIVVLTGGDDAGDSPKGTANAFAGAINERNVNGINNLMCEERDKIDPNDIEDSDFNEVSNVRVKSVSEPNGDSATAVLTATVDGLDKDQRFPMHKKNGKWCVGEPGGDDSGSSSATASAPSTG